MKGEIWLFCLYYNQHLNTHTCTHTHGNKHTFTPIKHHQIKWFTCNVYRGEPPVLFGRNCSTAVICGNVITVNRRWMFRCWLDLCIVRSPSRILLNKSRFVIVTQSVYCSLSKCCYCCCCCWLLCVVRVNHSSNKHTHILTLTIAAFFYFTCMDIHIAN